MSTERTLRRRLCKMSLKAENDHGLSKYARKSMLQDFARVRQSEQRTLLMQELLNDESPRMILSMIQTGRDAPAVPRIHYVHAYHFVRHA